MNTQKTSSAKVWHRTRTANLLLHKPSGKYYARCRVAGKLIFRSLNTNVYTTANLRLPDYIRAIRQQSEVAAQSDCKIITWDDALAVYIEKVKKDIRLKPNALRYRLSTLDFIHKTWPALKKTNLNKISEAQCLAWAAKFKDQYAPSVVNNTIDTLRGVLELAISSGTILKNPASKLNKMRIELKRLELPTKEQFQKFVEGIANAGARQSKDCAEMVEFIAYSGMRVGEVVNVKWQDIDRIKNIIHVHGDAVTGTKGGESRAVPIIPSMTELLKKMEARRGQVKPDETVLKIRECQKSMDRAAKLVGMKRITHHGLRHFFATICIESSVDIPTVSRWLGHKDGGALAMKVYGHLRDEHSQQAAQKVQFLTVKEKDLEDPMGPESPDASLS